MSSKTSASKSSLWSLASRLLEPVEKLRQRVLTTRAQEIDRKIQGVHDAMERASHRFIGDLPRPPAQQASESQAHPVMIVVESPEGPGWSGFSGYSGATGRSGYTGFNYPDNQEIAVSGYLPTPMWEVGVTPLPSGVLPQVESQESQVDPYMRKPIKPGPPPLRTLVD